MLGAVWTSYKDTALQKNYIAATERSLN